MAMLKTVSPEGWDFDRHAATTVKMSNDGRLRGHDRREFVKLAAGSENIFLPYLDRVKFAADEVPTHFIGLGAHEAYGGNRNGDTFREKGLIRYTPTFEKLARFYRNHCFPAGTPVVMGDRTRRDIAQIEVGDVVYTELGPRVVVRTMREAYAGPGVALRLNGLAEPLVGTPEHPVLAYKRSDLCCRHRYSVLTPSDHVPKCVEARDKAVDIGEPRYMPMSEIETGDYLCISPTGVGDVEVAPEFARLVGWVASEGHLGKKGSIQFTFSDKNVDDIRSVTACLEANGLHVGVTPVLAYGAVMLSSCSARLSAELSRFIVGVKSTKTLTSEVLDWTPAAKLQMLGAYIDGDGHTAYGRNYGQLRIRSSSQGMLYVLADVIRSLGVPATTQWDGQPGEMTSPTNGLRYSHDGSGVVAVASGYSMLVCAESRKVKTRVRQRTSTETFVGGRFLVRVDEREDVELEEDVYNLEVEQAHHYFANEVVVHNCNKDPAISYGVVKCAAYNRRMRRTELLIGLNAEKSAAERNGGLVADKELEKLAKGEDIPVSMSCRVPDDECSFCGNKARTREEYCKAASCGAGGCYDNLTKLVKVGNDVHHLLVHNDHPAFFDLSSVFRGADRIASGGAADWIKAAADAGGFFGVGGAKTAEDLGLVAPLSVVLYQDCPDDGVVSELVKLAYGMASLETHGPAAGLSREVARAFDPDMQPPIDFSNVGRGKEASALNAMADLKVVLPLREFARLTKQSSLLPAALGRLPGVYGRMASDGSMVPRLASTPYAAAPEPTESLKMAAARVAVDYSLESDAVDRRCVVSSIRGHDVPNLETGFEFGKSAADAGAGAAEELCRDYACYKVAALRRIAASDDEFLLTCRLGACQNRVI